MNNVNGKKYDIIYSSDDVQEEWEEGTIILKGYGHGKRYLLPGQGIKVSGDEIFDYLN